MEKHQLYFLLMDWVSELREDKGWDETNLSRFSQQERVIYSDKSGVHQFGITSTEEKIGTMLELEMPTQDMSATLRESNMLRNLVSNNWKKEEIENNQKWYRKVRDAWKNNSIIAL